MGLYCTKGSRTGSKELRTHTATRQLVGFLTRDVLASGLLTGDLKPYAQQSLGSQICFASESPSIIELRSRYSLHVSGLQPLLVEFQDADAPMDSSVSSVYGFYGLRRYGVFCNGQPFSGVVLAAWSMPSNTLSHFVSE